LTLILSSLDIGPWKTEAYEGAKSAFFNDGVSIVRSLVSSEAVQTIIQAFSDVSGRPGQRASALSAPVRDLTVPSGPLGRLAAFFAKRDMKPVRILFFDKTPETNWAVPWHQDRTISVKERVDAPGFATWSIKDGIAHVEPPVAVLERMITLRLFLDDCDADNGPLEIACDTHSLGRIPSQRATPLASNSRRFVAIGKAGDVLAMRLLCLHKSDRAAKPSRRRVLHVDYAGEDLPEPLQWREISD
jgi:hypothetical protein